MQFIPSKEPKLLNNKVVVLLLMLIVYKALALINFRIPIALLFGPFLLFFVSNQKLTYKFYILHTTPYLMFYLIRMYLQPFDVYVKYMYWYYIIYDTISIMSIISYIYYVNKHKEEFNLTSSASLFLRQLYFVFAIYIVVASAFLYRRIFNPEAGVSVVIDIMTTLLIMTFIISTLYLVSSYRKRILDKNSDAGLEKIKQHNQYGLSEYKLKIYAEQVEYFFKTSDMFLEMNFNLDKLSEQLQIPKHHLSVCFTQYYNSNFYKLLAKYRIEKAIELSDYLSIHTWESIAHDCGYSSRSTFNKHFKKITGCLPSEFSKTKEFTQ